MNGRELPDYTEGFNVNRCLIESEHELVPGEAGCTGSHIKIWKRMVQEQIPYAVVLEDDGVIPPEFFDMLKIPFAKTNFDYLKLDFHEPEIDVFSSGEQQLPQVVNGRQLMAVQARHDFHLYECDPVPFLTAGYVISLKGAKTFLNSSTNMYYPVDLLPRYTLGYTKQGFIYPPCVHHVDDMESVIPHRNFIAAGSVLNPGVLFHKLFNLSRARALSVWLRMLAIRLGKA